MSADFTKSLVCDVADDAIEHGICAWHNGRGVGCSCSCHDDPTPWLIASGERFSDAGLKAIPLSESNEARWMPRPEHERGSSANE